MEASDQDLVGLVAQGDRAAFAAFYDRHSPRVYGLILRILGRCSEADDVLQEVFWQVWQKAAQFDAGRGTPLMWVMVLARSRSLDHRRKAGRRKTSPGGAVEADSVAVGGEADSRTLQAEAIGRARTALEKLPLEQKSAIQMAFYGGWTYAEIAERQGEPLGTVKTRIRLGMQKLRDLLAEDRVVA